MHNDEVKIGQSSNFFHSLHEKLLLRRNHSMLLSLTVTTEFELFFFERVKKKVGR